MVEDWQQRCDSDDPWRRWLALPMVLRRQEQDEQTPRIPLRSSVLQFLRAATNWTHTAWNPWRLGFGPCETKFNEYGPLFIGLLGPTRRGDGVLHFLSINWTLIRLRLKDFWKGMNFGLVTVWKSNFSAGLTRLRKIPYPESIRRVWSG
jgi:hypothetical protein